MTQCFGMLYIIASLIQRVSKSCNSDSSGLSLPLLLWFSKLSGVLYGLFIMLLVAFVCVQTCLCTHTASLFLFASRGEWDLKPHSPLPKLCFSVSWGVKRRRELFIDMQPLPKIPQSAGQTGCTEIGALCCFCDILLVQQAGNIFLQHFLTNVDTSREGCLLLLSDFSPVQWMGISAESSPQPCCTSNSHGKEARQDLICGTQIREMSFQAQEIKLMSRASHVEAPWENDQPWPQQCPGNSQTSSELSTRNSPV